MVHTRDCLLRNTGRRISLQYVNVRRTLRNHDFPGFSGCIRLQLDGSIVTLSSGADHAEIKVLKFHREARKGVWKTDENATRICPLAPSASSQASTLRDININTAISCPLWFSYPSERYCIQLHFITLNQRSIIQIYVYFLRKIFFYCLYKILINLIDQQYYIL